MYTDYFHNNIAYFCNYQTTNSELLQTQVVRGKLPIHLCSFHVQNLSLRLQSIRYTRTYKSGFKKKYGKNTLFER